MRLIGRVGTPYGVAATRLLSRAKQQRNKSQRVRFKVELTPPLDANLELQPQLERDHAGRAITAQTDTE